MRPASYLLGTFPTAPLSGKRAHVAVSLSPKNGKPSHRRGHNQKRRKNDHQNHHRPPFDKLTASQSEEHQSAPNVSASSPIKNPQRNRQRKTKNLVFDTLDGPSTKSLNTERLFIPELSQFSVQELC